MSVQFHLHNIKIFDFCRSRSQNMSSQQAELESANIETNDSDTTDSYQVVSSTTDDQSIKNKGTLEFIYIFMYT